MSVPRFRLVRGCTRFGSSVPPWPTVLDPFAVEGRADGDWWSWRLLGANNRELGRGGRVHITEEECLAAIDDGRAKIALARQVTVFLDGRWAWQLEIEGEVFASAGRAYQRQRECRYSLGQFLLTLTGSDATAPDDSFPVNRVLERAAP
jgi:hypothetical protein